MGGTQHTVGSQNIRSYALLQLLLGYVGKSGGGCAALRGHDNVQGTTDMGCLAHYLPGYQSVSSEPAWKMWCDIWGIGYDDMIKRFASKELMLRNGMTDSRWYEGAIRDDINQPNRIKMVIVWGHSLNSISQMKKQKKGLEEVEMIVNIDPRANMASSLPERKSDLEILKLLADKLALAAGDPPTGRGRARFWARDITDPVPIHREPIESPRPDLIAKYPAYEDKDKTYYHVPCEFKTAQNPELVKKFSIILTTGRQVEHMGGGAQTRRSKILAEIQPDMYVEINPSLAGNIGVKEGEMVGVESNQGKVLVKAKITERVNEMTVFMPYHWAGVFEGASYEDRYPEGAGDTFYCRIVHIWPVS